MSRTIRTIENLEMETFTSEDELKAAMMSVEIATPKENENVRDRSCIVSFPRGASDMWLNRQIVKDILAREWGTLFKNVISFGNIDFSRKWVFFFDTMENNDKAVAKEIFINGIRVKTEHATRKFKILKIDWVPL